MSYVREIILLSRGDLVFQYLIGVPFFFLIFFGIAFGFFEKYFFRRNVRVSLISGLIGVLFWILYGYADYASSFYAMQCESHQGDVSIRLKFIFGEKVLNSRELYFKRGLNGYRGGSVWTYRVFERGDYGFKSVPLNIHEYRRMEAFGKSCGINE